MLDNNPLKLNVTMVCTFCPRAVLIVLGENIAPRLVRGGGRRVVLVIRVAVLIALGAGDLLKAKATKAA